MEDAPNAHRWNGGVSEIQLAWLDSVLARAKASNQHAVIFCHHPVSPQNPHNLLNDAGVIKIINRYENLVTFMSGHNHAGNYGVLNGVHYVTFHGMVETENRNAFAIIEVFPRKLKIRGFGREESRILQF